MRPARSPRFSSDATPGDGGGVRPRGPGRLPRVCAPATGDAAALGRGFWAVSLRAGAVFSACSEPSCAALRVSPRLHGAEVFLNGGIVSSCRVGETSHVVTFTQVPAEEPLRPFFSASHPSQDDQSFLRICPMSLGTGGPRRIRGKASGPDRRGAGRELSCARGCGRDVPVCCPRGAKAQQRITEQLMRHEHKWYKRSLHFE